MINALILRGKVSLDHFELDELVKYQQFGSKFIHKALFKGITNGENNAREAWFVYRSFSDNELKKFNLPVLGTNAGTGYLDFGEINFENSQSYLGTYNGSENDYYNIWNKFEGND